MNSKLFFENLIDLNCIFQYIQLSVIITIYHVKTKKEQNNPKNKYADNLNLKRPKNGSG